MANLTITGVKLATAVTAGQERLLTPDPKEAFFSSGTSVTVGLDLGASYSLDNFFLGFLSANVTAVTVFTGASLGALTTNQGAMNLGPTTARRRHAWLKLGSPVSSRYVSFSVAASAGGWTAGVAVAGLALQPTWGHEWGSGRMVDDRSAKQPLFGGGYAIERGARVPGWQWTLGDLTDAELATAFDLLQDVGQSGPVLVSEDPGAAQPALNENIHYGLFDKLEAYERQSPGQSRMSFRLLEWI